MTATSTTGAASAAPRLTSLAAVKRACVKGAHLAITEFTVPPGTSPEYLQVTQAAGPRPISRVQTNAIYLRGVHKRAPGGGFAFDAETEGWLPWPKASQVTAHGDDRFTLDFGGGRTITYRVIP